MSLWFPKFLRYVLGSFILTTFAGRPWKRDEIFSTFSAFVGDLLQEQFSLPLGSVFFVGINRMRCFEMALIKPVGT